MNKLWLWAREIRWLAVAGFVLALIGLALAIVGFVLSSLSLALVAIPFALTSIAFATLDKR